MTKPSKSWRRLTRWITGSSSGEPSYEKPSYDESPAETPPPPTRSPPRYRSLDPAELFDHVPAWLLRRLPANAPADESLETEIDAARDKLPAALYEFTVKLNRVRAYREYDSAANRASAWVWLALDHICSCEPRHRTSLLSFACLHMIEKARARVIRRLAKDSDLTVRRTVRRLLEKTPPREVALPANRGDDWSPSGWLDGVETGRLFRPRRRMQARTGLPEIRTVGKLRELLGIKSRRQLGYFLLASDRDGGPYHRFTIPKRDGTGRDICAPQNQLRWFQQQILRKILDKVPVHHAAHGFVSGRSTVTNAEPHQGAEVILKFDLEDFFPTIHYYRIVGLFASLGYALENPRFSTADKSRQVAATLARLCTYTPDPTKWAMGVLPQGAPTSPAISNLVARGLDARLDGLAKRNAGVYTRYADDLTFSFREAPLGVGRFRWWVDQVCHQEGFLVNQGKFRVIRRSQRQTVTGIVVNDTLRVPRRARRRFRAILHNCRKHGLESQSRGRPGLKAYLRGFASYIHMVHPEEGAELLRQVDALLGPEP